MDMLAMLLFDPMYMVFVAPAILLAIWAQVKVKSAFASASEYASQRGLTGAQAAQRILNAYGLTDVAIEPAHSFLGDHYDPRHRVLRLSPDVYHGRSLAAMGVAAHEVGHALQQAAGYAPLAIRNGIVPLASVGSQLSWALILLGLILMGAQSALGPSLAIGGFLLFGTVVLFQIVNLPVEFNASSRARAVLIEQGIVSEDEDAVVAKVLHAAAMTYVAATAVAVLQMLYLAYRIFGRRD